MTGPVREGTPVLVLIVIPFFASGNRDPYLKEKFMMN
jgi:hypothetical protein